MVLSGLHSKLCLRQDALLPPKVVYWSDYEGAIFYSDQIFMLNLLHLITEYCGYISSLKFGSWAMILNFGGLSNFGWDSSYRFPTKFFLRHLGSVKMVSRGSK